MDTDFLAFLPHTGLEIPMDIWVIAPGIPVDAELPDGDHPEEERFGVTVAIEGQVVTLVGADADPGLPPRVEVTPRGNIDARSVIRKLDEVAALPPNPLHYEGKDVFDDADLARALHTEAERAHRARTGGHAARTGAVLHDVLDAVHRANIAAYEENYHLGPEITVPQNGGYTVVSGAGACNENLDYPEEAHVGLTLHSFTSHHEEIGILDLTAGDRAADIAAAIARLKGVKAPGD
ncbi:hypothetical protein [Nocardiopsis halophila]|uniref:hypothetical protein n=1 Tax=Nocardiopsis halophila TaxID=141692 RepID=UPI000346D66B|nr:hypothetical protein [Nocardiopsis halophila]